VNVVTGNTVAQYAKVIHDAPKAYASPTVWYIAVDPLRSVNSSASSTLIDSPGRKPRWKTGHGRIERGDFGAVLA